jgi:phosphoglycolate phosphatase
MLTCLFDLDGTLVDSREPILTALNAALADHGEASVTDDTLWRYVGPPLHDTITALLAERDGDPGLVAPLIDSFRGHYSATSLAQARTFEGIPDLLEDLYGSALLGVVTSKPVPFARPILETLGLAGFMEIIEGPGLEETEQKPETLARALRHLDQTERSSSCVMIGDRRHDIEAARANGISSIGVTWGFGTERELIEAGAGTIAGNPMELTELLGS